MSVLRNEKGTRPIRPALIDSGAEFSEDRLWRFRLWRRWGDGPLLMVVGLNPSKADEGVDDPTVSKCQVYAERWGLSGLMMLNLFAWRDTDPVAMKKSINALDRDTWIKYAAQNLSIIQREANNTLAIASGAILVAWGNHGTFKGHDFQCLKALREHRHMLWCLGKTKAGQPRHPLYQPYDIAPEYF